MNYITKPGGAVYLFPPFLAKKESNEMESEKLPQRFAGSDWRRHLSALKRKRERKKREPLYQNSACARCGGIKFNLKMAVGVKKLMVVCVGCMRKKVFAYR